MTQILTRNRVGRVVASRTDTRVGHTGIPAHIAAADPFALCQPTTADPFASPSPAPEAGEGPDVPAALADLAAAGIHTRAVAAGLAVSVRTVQRWRAGRHQPNRRNHTALAAMVEDLQRGIIDGTTLASERQAEHLRLARLALRTATERRADRNLTARMAIDLTNHAPR